MNQHYVPRLYLKRFANHDEQIFVYDKFTRNAFGPTNITNVAGEKNFYDIAFKEGFDSTDLNPQFAENLFASWESKFNEVIEVAIGVAEGGGAGLEERATMSFFLAMQMVRTRTARNKISQAMRLLTETSLNSALELASELSGQREKFKDVTVNVKSQSRREEAGMHFAHMWNIDGIKRTAEALFDRIWLLGINQTSCPLITSDNPIVLQAHLPLSRPKANPNIGPSFYKAIDIAIESDFPSIGEEGVELVFPLTPKYALIVLEETFFSEFWEMQGRRIALDLDLVQCYNQLQVLQSYRQIYSHQDDFAFIDGVYGTHPEAFDPDRKIFRVKTWKWG